MRQARGTGKPLFSIVKEAQGMKPELRHAALDRASTRVGDNSDVANGRDAR
jgi:hypothetical protein